jgi:hypothetical protein
LASESGDQVVVRQPGEYSDPRRLVGGGEQRLAVGQRDDLATTPWSTSNGTVSRLISRSLGQASGISTD